MSSRIILVLFLVLYSFSCTSIRKIEKHDNLGRVSQVIYLAGNNVDRIEELEYYGNSHNPKRIVYMKKVENNYHPYKEEVYRFIDNNLSELSFFIYIGEKRITTGMLRYYYNRNFLKRTEFYSFNEKLKKMIILGLDQYIYNKKQLIKRRLIEYEYNLSTGKSMQVGQYLVVFENKIVKSMKYSIMDKKSKKIIEKRESNSEKVLKTIESIEEYYNKMSRGRQFINK
jgi:hypothetical protein